MTQEVEIEDARIQQFAEGVVKQLISLVPSGRVPSFFLQELAVNLNLVLMEWELQLTPSPPFEPMNKAIRKVVAKMWELIVSSATDFSKNGDTLPDAEKLREALSALGRVVVEEQHMPKNRVPQ
jgi:hypothetical protein